MTAAEVLDLVHSAIWVALIVSAPVIIAVMIVGLAISVFQALTQVQEMTLTFVPKIVAAMLVLSVAAPFIGKSISSFAERTFLLIERPKSGGAAENSPGARRP